MAEEPEADTTIQVTLTRDEQAVFLMVTGYTLLMILGKVGRAYEVKRDLMGMMDTLTGLVEQVTSQIGSMPQDTTQDTTQETV